jgi:desulfoferrodoxin (superoxide reductase-like protein)
MNKRAVVVDDGQVEDESALIEVEDETTELDVGENNAANDQGVEIEAEDGAGESDEVVVSIGEEAPPAEEEQRAPEWVRELRKANREKERRIRELEARLQTTTQTENKPVALGPKPKLEEFDYDADRFEQALDTWHERKRQHDLQTEMVRQAELQQHQAWQAKLDSYSKAKAELRVRDYEDAEALAQEVFNVTQQGVILQGAENPALVIYALGKNPKKAAELAKKTDPVKFAFAVAKLEKELKVTNRRAAPAPERIVQGTGRVAGAVDSTLERLRAEAEKTGNYTKVLQYKRQKQAAPRN